MNVALKRPMSLAEFLAWEDRQELRYEFDGFQPLAMTGGTLTHGAIRRNLAIAIGSRLRGHPCRFFGSDVKIETLGRIRYPDGFVMCSVQPANTKVVRDPVVVFEVLSHSTALTDLVTKNHEYAEVPSVRRYVMLTQDGRVGLMFERAKAGWVGSLLTAEAILRMPEIGIEVPVHEFFEGVEFPSDQADD